MKLIAARLVLGLVVFVLVGWAAGALWTSVVGSGELEVMRNIADERSAGLTAAARVVTWAGSAFVLVPLALICCLVLLRAGLRWEAFAVAVSLAGAMLISDVVKLLVSRPRPPVEHLQAVTGSSFPSGHATQASAFWFSLVLGAAGGASGTAAHPRGRRPGARARIGGRSLACLPGRPLSRGRDRRRPARDGLGGVRRALRTGDRGQVRAPAFARIRGRVQRLDQRLMRRSVRVRSPGLDRALVGITRAANYSRLWLLIAGGLAACGGRRGRRAAARGIIAIAIAAAVANGPAKLLVRRRRPSGARGRR